jgi:simple sugar transport system ATP-binding protein
MEPLIELRDVSKYFGIVIALNGVSFAVQAGEVHCLLGDNGAGKSTLIKTLSGVHTPSKGEILVQASRSVSARRAMHSMPASPRFTRIWRPCR